MMKYAVKYDFWPYGGYHSRYPWIIWDMQLNEAYRGKAKPGEYAPRFKTAERAEKELLKIREPNP